MRSLSLRPHGKQAAAAAHILAREARERGFLVADLIAEASSPALIAASPPPESAALTWREVEPAKDGPYVKRIDAQHVGLVTEVIDETEKAWRVEMPDAEPAWLPKSQCEFQGLDPVGRAILVLSRWLAVKIRLRATP